MEVLKRKVRLGKQVVPIFGVIICLIFLAACDWSNSNLLIGYENGINKAEEYLNNHVMEKEFVINDQDRNLELLIKQTRVSINDYRNDKVEFAEVKQKFEVLKENFHQYKKQVESGGQQTSGSGAKYEEKQYIIKISKSKRPRGHADYKVEYEKYNIWPEKKLFQYLKYYPENVRNPTSDDRYFTYFNAVGGPSETKDELREEIKRKGFPESTILHFYPHWEKGTSTPPIH